jgi:hypothetical protein
MYLQNKKPCSCLRKQEQVEYQFFLFFSLRQITWQRQPGEVHTILTGVPISSCAPSSSHQWVPGASPSTPTDFGIRIRTHYNELKWLTNMTTKPSGWWNFMSNVSIYCPGCPRTSRKFKNQKFKFCKYRDSNPVPRRCLCRSNALTAWPQAP